MRLICAAIVVVLGCGGSRATETETETETESETAAETVTTETPGDDRENPQPEEGAGEELVGRIVDRGPIGSGACIQQSYEVETDDGDRLWIHFEACGTFDGPLFDALESGRRYRFAVERGASPNFAGDPMIVGAELLSEP